MGLKEEDLRKLPEDGIDPENPGKYGGYWKIYRVISSGDMDVTIAFTYLWSLNQINH
ncbi:hypothetical protein [Cylindrospermopsis raciborskii]|uniref:hypothetical protein n=1 Tax=Cylindrospermopsis raciborskii TaxID=77022 RepID=UPI00215ABA6A|nr:hypothetical protein [Cylindrospermopsis raciborskii]